MMPLILREDREGSAKRRRASQETCQSDHPYGRAGCASVGGKVPHVVALHRLRIVTVLTFQGQKHRWGPERPDAMERHKT